MNLVIKALDPSNVATFIKAQWNFYRDDPHWVPPLLMDRKKLLNKEKNPFYRHAEMQLFIAQQGKEIVGRIAAIVNHNHNLTHKDTVGFFGFFECIQDQGVATALFAAAEQWLRDRGMTRIRGPVNPSMNDEVGLLVHGFDGPPVILMTYNPPYYAQLIEDAGFDKAKDLYAYLIRQEDYRSEKLLRLAERIKERNEVSFRNIDLKNTEQFRKDLETIKQMYNTAWSPNWGFVKMTDDEFEFLAADLKQIADPEYIFFAEVKGQPAGFILCLPDVNQAFIHNRRGSALGALFHLLTKKSKIDLLRIVILGVLPEYQKLGIDALLYHEIGLRSQPRGIKAGEASWILEDNSMMNRGLTQVMNGDRYRTYRLFEKAL